MKQSNYSRWFTSYSTKTLMLFKRDGCSKGICYIRTEDDAKFHMKACNMTNLEYLEAVNRLKEINKNA